MAPEMLTRPGRAVLIALVAVMLAVASFGCTAAPPSSKKTPSRGTGTASLLISSEFGGKVMKTKTIAFSEGDTVMDALRRNAKVQTAYGGGFVNAIEGLKSRYTGSGASQNDWFYYVNGVQPQVGAGEYRLRKGDRIWWDYHSWKRWQMIPAVVGHFPEPFAHGFEGRSLPTSILYGSGFEHEAKALKETLAKAGVKDILLMRLPAPETKNGRSRILLGLRPQVGRAFEGVKADLPLEVDGKNVVILDENGKRVDGQSGAGLVASVNAGDGTLDWFVTGTSENGVRKAAQLLIRGDPRLQGVVSVIVDPKGNVIRSPKSRC